MKNNNVLMEIVEEDFVGGNVVGTAPERRKRSVER